MRRPDALHSSIEADHPSPVGGLVNLRRCPAAGLEFPAKLLAQTLQVHDLAINGPELLRWDPGYLTAILLRIAC